MMFKTSRILIRLAANYGLGIVLSILMAGGFAWFAQFTLTENAKREAGYQMIIGKNQEAIAEQLRVFAAYQLQNTSLLQKHDERSKEFLENDGGRRERLVVALNDLTKLINDIRMEIRDSRSRRGG